jgi:2-oxoglutarate ferredoxin oxidoreductase subunit alpha
MSGNDAIVAGALLAGCRFYAGYPITPASDIMEALARELPKVGGVFLQAEDEIAAAAAMVGAAYAGAKAMTATSGPGLSLMVEVLGLASMAELPCVVVDAQRAGPSTGMPTKMEQGDLNLALWGGHGDVPRIVVAPGSVEDCFYQTIRAFNLAEKYQTPVILLTDQSLAHRTQTMLEPDISKIEIVDRLRAEAPNGGFKRFAITETGVSPIAIPGTPHTMYVAPGLEHDEYAHPRYDPQTHNIMTEKRFRKLQTAARVDAGPVERSGVADPVIGVIGWGSSEGPVREAIERAVAAGYKVAALYPKVISPLPREEVGAFIDSVERVLVPEANYLGQFANYLAATFGIKPVRVNKYGGIPFTTQEIFRAIEEASK